MGALAVQPQSDLGIVVSVDNASPTAGSQIVYTLTVTNYGPSDANNILVSDVLPANTVYVSDNGGGSYDNLTGIWILNPPKLVSGTSSSLAITVTANTPAAGNTFTNTATITGSNRPDPDATNNISSVDVTIAGAVLTMLKSASTISDPVNGTVMAYNIPGAVVLYSLQTTNTGQGVADSNSVIITDPIPANAELFVNDLGGAGSGPVVFINGSSPVNSNLSYTYTSLSNLTDDLEFSSDNGTSWTYTPVPDANGYDANVTNIRINPKGTMNASDGTNNPTFTLRFRVRVK